MSSFWWSTFHHDPQHLEWLKERYMLFNNMPEYKALTWDKFLENNDFLSMSHSISLRPVINNAVGVFTHARFFADMLAEEYNLPVGYSYLPVRYKQSNDKDERSVINEIIDNARAQGRFIVVSTGVIHQVKRSDKITSVLLRNKELRDKICCIMTGEIHGEYCDRLIELSRNHLKDSLFLPGRQPDSVMFRTIDEADLCINLRYPNSEVCSLSLLEQMSHKKAILVIRTGVYGEVPGDAVLRLELEPHNLPDHKDNFKSDDRAADYNEINGELNEIERILLKFVRGEIDTTETGKNAYRFVREFANTESYACNFSGFINNFAKDHELRKLQKKFLVSIAERSEALFGNYNEIPDYTENIIKNIDRLFNQK